MNKSGGTSSIARVEAEATRLVERMAAGEATREQIERWRGQSQLHAQAYEDAERVWTRIAAVSRAQHSAQVDYVAPLRELGKQRSALNRRLVLGGGLAAISGAAGYSVIRPPLSLWPSLSELRADFRTGTGEQRAIRFAETVAINLNTQTSLVVRPASEGEDRIELVSGEASFATTADSTRALAVLAANGRTVSGPGRFEVRYIGTGTPVVVTCYEGQLRVECQGEIFQLLPGQRVSYGDTGLGKTTLLDPSAEPEWQRGIVEFRNTPLAEAVEEINRYRPGRIILISSALGRRLLSGRFRIDQMDKALLQLEHTFSAKLTRLPGGVVLLG